MGHGFSKMKKQAKQMQAQYSQMQAELKEQEATGSSGLGLVTITLSGNHEMKKIVIQPTCVDPNDIEALQDLIQAAYTDALEKLQSQTSSVMPNMPFSF